MFLCVVRFPAFRVCALAVNPLVQQAAKQGTKHGVVRQTDENVRGQVAGEYEREATKQIGGRRQEW